MSALIFCDHCNTALPNVDHKFIFQYKVRHLCNPCFGELLEFFHLSTDDAATSKKPD
jgi:hypothetical protein